MLTHAAVFALTPEKQAQVPRRGKDDAERNAAKQAEAEAPRVGKELEHQERGNSTQVLMAVTAAKLKEHPHPQQREDLESDVANWPIMRTSMANR